MSMERQSEDSVAATGAMFEAATALLSARRAQPPVSIAGAEISASSNRPRQQAVRASVSSVLARAHAESQVLGVAAVRWPVGPAMELANAAPRAFVQGMAPYDAAAPASQFPARSNQGVHAVDHTSRGASVRQDVSSVPMVPMPTLNEVTQHAFSEHQRLEQPRYRDPRRQLLVHPVQEDCSRTQQHLQQRHQSRPKKHPPQQPSAERQRHQQQRQPTPEQQPLQPTQASERQKQTKQQPRSIQQQQLQQPRNDPAKQQQRQSKREKDQGNSKQPRATKKRKTKGKQRQEIDEIVEQAEQQPDFARPEYTTQLEPGFLITQDEVLSRRSAIAVIRPGQSIVPAPYQRRPIEIDPRSRAMPGIPGLAMGDASQRTRACGAPRVLPASLSTTTNSPALVQRFPRPAFPSPNDESTLNSSLWSHRQQHQSHLYQQSRSMDLMSHQQVLYSSVNQRPVHQDLRPSDRISPPGRESLAVNTFELKQRLNQLDRNPSQVQLQEGQQSQHATEHVHRQAHQSHRRDTPVFIPADALASSTRIAPANNQASHSRRTVHQHSYVPSPEVQHPMTGSKFEDALWSDIEQVSATARNVNSRFQGGSNAGNASFVNGLAAATSVNQSFMLPSLDFRSTRQSDWFYPSPEGTKKITLSTNQSSIVCFSGEEMMKNGSLLEGSGVADQFTTTMHGDKGATSLSMGETGTHSLLVGEQLTKTSAIGEEGESFHDKRRSFDFDSKLVDARTVKATGKSMSNNKIRKMDKQSRRYQRKENAKNMLSKDLSKRKVSQAQQLQVLHVNHPPHQPHGQLIRSQQSLHSLRTSTAHAQLFPHERVQQQRQPRDRDREVLSSADVKATIPSSDQPGATISRQSRQADDRARPTTALQREQELLLRRAHLAMVAQQRLHQRNPGDFHSHPRLLPTVVASSAASIVWTTNKRARNESESQKFRLQSSPPGVRFPPLPATPIQGLSKVQEASCGPLTSERQETWPKLRPVEQPKLVTQSGIQLTATDESASRENVEHDHVRSSQVDLAVSSSRSSAAPTTDFVEVPTPASTDKKRKARKRKAGVPLATVLNCSSQQADAVALVEPCTQNPTIDRSRILDTTSEVDIEAAVETNCSLTDTSTLNQKGAVVAPMSVISRAETETVMIFCKRDFFRFQAGLLWKKYQEIKRKREQTRATVTGRRARYLNARYNGSHEGDLAAHVVHADEAGQRSDRHTVLDPSSTAVVMSDDLEPLEVCDDGVHGNHGVDEQEPSVQTERSGEKPVGQDAVLAAHEHELNEVTTVEVTIEEFKSRDQDVPSAGEATTSSTDHGSDCAADFVCSQPEQCVSFGGSNEAATDVQFSPDQMLSTDVVTDFQIPLDQIPAPGQLKLHVPIPGEARGYSCELPTLSGSAEEIVGQGPGPHSSLVGESVGPNEYEDIGQVAATTVCTVDEPGKIAKSQVQVAGLDDLTNAPLLEVLTADVFTVAAVDSAVSTSSVGPGQRSTAHGNQAEASNLTIINSTGHGSDHEAGEEVPKGDDHGRLENDAKSTHCEDESKSIPCRDPAKQLDEESAFNEHSHNESPHQAITILPSDDKPKLPADEKLIEDDVQSLEGNNSAVMGQQPIRHAVVSRAAALSSTTALVAQCIVDGSCNEEDGARNASATPQPWDPRAQVFGGDDAEYVIIEEDTFGDWSGASVPATPETQEQSGSTDDVKSGGSNALPAEPRPEGSYVETMHDVHGSEITTTLQSAALIAVATVSTGEWLAASSVAPVKSLESTEVSDSTTSPAMQPPPVVHREECVI